MKAKFKMRLAAERAKNKDIAALQESQSQTHRLPVSISPVAPKAEEVAIVSEAFGGRVCLAGCLTGGELTPMSDDTRLQTFSSLLLIFRDREKVC